MNCKVNDISSEKLIKVLKMYYKLYFLTIFTLFSNPFLLVNALKILFP